jgi:hypothetical protein
MQLIMTTCGSRTNAVPSRNKQIEAQFDFKSNNVAFADAVRHGD